MQQQPKRSRVIQRTPEAILCLIDGYPSHSLEGREGSFGAGPAMEGKMRMLDQYAGRWMLVSERIRVAGELVRVGTAAENFVSRGYETAIVNNKTYARHPHPGGLPIDSVVTKLPRRHVDPLPVVESDEFEWSANELHNAIATARSWLFPIEGTQAA